MAFSAITVRIRFQNEDGSLVYQGDGTSNLRLWGAVFELGAENTERALGSFATQYRYIRSLGAPGDALSSRYIFDARPDVVTIGLDDARRLQTGTGTDQNWISPTGQNLPINTSATLTTTWQRFSFTGAITSTAKQLFPYFVLTPVGTAGANDYFEITGVEI